MTQPWGYDPAYGGNAAHVHYGVDFACPQGTPVLAVADGHVVMASNNAPVGFPGTQDGAWGSYVEVDHGNGVASGYAHLQALVAYPSQPVRAGQLLGLSGMTGLAFGAHLHFQVLEQGKRVDPARYLDN